MGQEGRFWLRIPVILDTLVLLAHYKLREVLKTDRILVKQYCRSIADSMSEAPGNRNGGVRGGGGGVRGGSCIELGYSPGGCTQVLQSSLHPYRTVLSLNKTHLACRVFPLLIMLHLNANLRSEEAAAKMSPPPLVS